MRKKGDLPGWNAIIMLALGLFGLVLLAYIIFRSKGSAFESLDFIGRILGLG